MVGYRIWVCHICRLRAGFRAVEGVCMLLFWLDSEGMYMGRGSLFRRGLGVEQGCVFFEMVW